MLLFFDFLVNEYINLSKLSEDYIFMYGYMDTCCTNTVSSFLYFRSQETVTQLYPVEDVCWVHRGNPGPRNDRRQAGPGSMQLCQRVSWSPSSPDPKSDFFPSWCPFHVLQYTSIMIILDVWATCRLHRKSPNGVWWRESPACLLPLVRLCLNQLF
jgi:hypothetical protein